MVERLKGVGVEALEMLKIAVMSATTDEVQVDLMAIDDVAAHISRLLLIKTIEDNMIAVIIIEEKEQDNDPDHREIVEINPLAEMFMEELTTTIRRIAVEAKAVPALDKENQEAMKEIEAVADAEEAAVEVAVEVTANQANLKSQIV